jgi:hypothetical protein
MDNMRVRVTSYVHQSQLRSLTTCTSKLSQAQDTVNCIAAKAMLLQCNGIYKIIIGLIHSSLSKLTLSLYSFGTPTVRVALLTHLSVEAKAEAAFN